MDPPHVDGVTHRYVAARGLRFHVAEAGSGDDVVLLLHGYPQHWYLWRHQIPVLAREHRVLALDLRGFGWSDAPRDGYAKEDMADDVLAVLDALGVQTVSLIAHDWGGWIGYLLCLRAPQRFTRFMALSIVPPWPSAGSLLRGGWRLWYQWVLSAPWLGSLGQRRRFFTRSLLRGATGDGFVWDPADLAMWVDSVASPQRAWAGVQLYRSFTVSEALPIVRGRYARAQLTVPTLAVFGTQDPAQSPSMFATVDDHADDMRVELVDGVGHFLVDERPALVTERAVAFLAG
jgi:pimeloyl-ACP methyl ester carboxylesterase